MAETEVNCLKPVTSAPEVSTGVDGVKRLAGLDGLRGLAGLSVLLHHILGVFPPVWDATMTLVQGRSAQDVKPAIYFLTFTPLHAIWQGEGAVLLFFALSGFVLTLPFLSSNVDYGAFLKRRILRIYPACWVVLAFSLAGMRTWGYHVPARANLESIPVWLIPSDPQPNVFWQFSLISPGFAYLNPSVWSLRIEVIASLLFPYIVAPVISRPWRSVVASLGAIYAVSILMLNAPMGFISEIGRTFSYLTLFGGGALIARHREGLRVAMLSRPGSQRISILSAGALLYTIRWECAPLRLGPISIELTRLGEWVGVIVILTCAVAWPAFESLLCNRAAVWLGRVSYSLYLVHLVILEIFVGLCGKHIPLIGCAALTLVCSLAAAKGLHALIEAPFQRVARHISTTPTRSHIAQRAVLYDL